MNKPYPKWIVFAAIPILVAAAVLSIWLAVSEDQQDGASPTSNNALKSPKVELGLVATGFKSPTGIVSTNIPRDNRIFIVERGGSVRTINAGGSPEDQVFLDIKSRVMDDGEMGLLGLAFHPDYLNNGYLYVNYVDKTQNTIIARYQVARGQNHADANSEKVLIKLKQPYPNHNGGDLQFGPDKFLYIALGDGGSGGDPQNRAQDKTTLLGKILRIDVNSGDPYSIPATNPFATESAAKPEIWAFGLRNPWRVSFDKTTGDFYIADVGQNTTEEINFQKAESKGGENYGWRCFEGTKNFNGQGCGTPNLYTPPVTEYTHEENRCSITGGYVYRGNQSKALTGKYFYGDLCSGQLFYVSNDSGKWQPVMAAKTPYSISAFGQDGDGELYIADFSTGSIYRIRDRAN